MTLGLLLAAGAGRRMGMPKALVRDATGRPWLVGAVEALLDGGCRHVIVVLGAEADAAEWLLTEGRLDLSRVEVVRAVDWERGMGASLRTGLVAALEVHPDGPGPIAEQAVIHLVDLPDVGAAVVSRLLADTPEPGPAAARATLARAAYGGVPGHPVLLGRDHWAPIRDTASGDRGARDYLATHPVRLVECGDLATGADVDTPTADQRAIP